MSATRAFERRLDALGEIVAFCSEALAGSGLAEADRMTLDFALEELFTNMLKYSPAGVNPVRITLEPEAGGVAVTLVDTGVEPFDVTAAPDADTALPLAQRQPGGLGLHLVRRLVGALSYEYRAAARESRIGFRVPRGPA
ncbi:MAG TPA: ATP-binding protein [Burkholderiaceae bacterium]|nr:ATP-binding protein [Burkholderiaceae bacterium]